MNRRTFTGLLAGAPLALSANTVVQAGFVYNGPKNDLGYNQAHADGRLALRSVPYVHATEEANVPETVAVEESMRNIVRR